MTDYHWLIMHMIAQQNQQQNNIVDDRLYNYTDEKNWSINKKSNT